MGIYVFSTNVLIEALEKIKEVDLDFGKHIIPYLIKENYDIYAYKFEGYWRDVGTYDSYLDANIEFTEGFSQLNLYDESWKIYTRSEEKPPVRITSNALIKDSLLSNGCIIKGTVINSVLSPGVYVDRKSTRLNSSHVRISYAVF